MKKYLYSLLLLIAGSMVFVSCDKEDVEPVIPDPVYGSTGLFVLNEGNYYSGVNGSLSFLNYSSSTLTDGLFNQANSRSLGGTPNDMVEVNGKLYICCTDENRVEIVDAKTYKSISYVEVTQPREVCASTSSIFVSSYDGTVYSISFDGQLLKQSEKVGACLEGIAAKGEYVYVCNAYNADYTYNTNIVKLYAETLVKVSDIIVASNPTQIEVSGSSLYVLSTGNYYDVQSQIQVIDSEDKVKYLCDATHMAIDDSYIYAINSVTDWSTYTTTTEYFKYNTTTGDRKELINDVDAKSIASPCGIAVDQYNNYLYISSYNMGASGYADYSGNGYIMQFTNDGSFVKKYDAGVGPTTMVPFVVQVN